VGPVMCMSGHASACGAITMQHLRAASAVAMTSQHGLAFVLVDLIVLIYS
jgi:hypothetical protein